MILASANRRHRRQAAHAPSAGLLPLPGIERLPRPAGRGQVGPRGRRRRRRDGLLEGHHRPEPAAIRRLPRADRWRVARSSPAGPRVHGRLTLIFRQSRPAAAHVRPHEQRIRCRPPRICPRRLPDCQGGIGRPEPPRLHYRQDHHRCRRLPPASARRHQPLRCCGPVGQPATN